MNAVGLSVGNLRHTLSNISRIITRIHHCESMHCNSDNASDASVNPITWNHVDRQHKIGASSVTSSQMTPM